LSTGPTQNEQMSAIRVAVNVATNTATQNYCVVLQSFIL
jgi:hypothetical protein